ncbi:MAG: hypothetical protein AAF468_01775 [Pseudomonadota bacterium]
MTDIAYKPEPALGGWRRFSSAEPALAATGVMMLIMMLPTTLALLIEVRTVNGINPWIKPLKFQFSLAAYTLTLVLFARYLPVGLLETRWYRRFMTAVVFAIFAEMAWIMAASASGHGSHFYEEGLIWIALYPLMGLFAVLLTSTTTVFAWHIWKNQSADLSPAVKSGVVIGLALTLPATCITAGYLAGNGGHWVGGTPSDASGLAFFGWARDGGDLRVAHFFATHAMHFIPAFAVLSALIFGAKNRLPVYGASIAFAALIAITFVQAINGQPFLGFLG